MAPELVHILAIPLPFQGHINPILHMLSRISSPDLITTLLVVEQDMVRIHKSLHGNPYVHLKPIPSSIIDIEKMTSLPSTHQLFYALDAFEKSLNNLHQAIQNLHLEPPISCLLTDVFVQMGQDLANKLQVPRVGMWTSGAASFLVSFSVKSLLSQGILSPPVSLQDLETPVNCLPGLDNLRKGDLPHSLLFPRGEEELQKRMLTFSRTHEAACIIINTVEEVDRKSIEAMRTLAPEPKYLAVGPLLPGPFLKDLVPGETNTVISHGEGLWKEDVACLTWLDRQKPGSVLYVSFGSMANLSPDQIQQLAAGVESSNQPFLWVLRPNLVSEILPEDFLPSFTERTKSRGLIIAWAPQLQVLKHPAVGAFLTHCGWNSTLEAMSSGVPMLGWPCFAEQNLNCKLVVDEWKVGLTFRRSFEGVADKAEVERVIRVLMEQPAGQEIRQRALEIRDVIRSSVEPAGSSQRNLRTFVDLFSRS